MSAVRENFDHYFFAPVAAVRPLLVEKCVLVLLALDMWFLRLGMANRYDEKELNLAHFDWLDAVSPAPSAGLFVGVAMLTGMLALVIAMANLGVAWRLALLILYSYTWAMSRLDSFQHHYLLSWVLLCIAFFPRVRVADFRGETAERSRSPLVSAWAWVLLGVFAAIVYAYTTIAKLDPVWQSGACVQQLEGTATLMKPLESAFVALGGKAGSFWNLMAQATVVAEVLLSAGYLLMTQQDRLASRWVSRMCFVCWLLAIGLHASFELAGLRIGWFSYFMMLLASTSFLPASWLERFIRPLVWLDGSARATQQATPRGVLAITSLLAIATLLAVAWWFDLPGLLPAAGIGTVGFVAALTALGLKGECDAQCRLPVALLVAAILLATALEFGGARANFYPYRLRQLQRRGDFEAAREMLPKATTYVDHDDLYGQNNLAWFYATVEDASLRDGAEAIKFAKRTCKLCDYGNASALNTLACAQAANGEFDDALDTIRQAKELLRDHKGGPIYSTLLEHEGLFTTGRPYVDAVRYRYHQPEP